MMLRHGNGKEQCYLRTDAQICGKSASQASFFVHIGSIACAALVSTATLFPNSVGSIGLK